jgi:hypothetical protein
MFRVDNCDVLDWCKNYKGEKFHALLCDPPYEYGMMNMSWDSTGIAFNTETWEALKEHLYPGAFIMAFSGARTYHRMACAIEDAGFITHPMLIWIYSSGFPKAANLSKLIDKADGLERKDTGLYREVHDITSGRYNRSEPYNRKKFPITKPASKKSEMWENHRYGLQCLKPALEPICLAQVPYEKKPVDSIVKYGAGALNIEGGRIPHNEECKYMKAQSTERQFYAQSCRYEPTLELKPEGRWPANLLISDVELGEDANRYFFNADYLYEKLEAPFFYGKKASKKERDAGLDNFEFKVGGGMLGTKDKSLKTGSGNERNNLMKNPHPTCKPISLTKYLANLLLPPAEYYRRILVPFSGVSSEMIGCVLAGWEEVIGIEKESEYAEIGEERLKWWSQESH